MVFGAKTSALCLFLSGIGNGARELRFDFLLHSGTVGRPSNRNFCGCKEIVNERLFVFGFKKLSGAEMEIQIHALVIGACFCYPVHNGSASTSTERRYMMKIGENIRNARRRQDMTQEQLAEYLNLSVSAVSQWESGGSLR